jgi:UDP:flavonoid glycosyltransferase YjiC (YdhE family)
MKTIIFSPAVYNLAETTRALEVAKACRQLFHILFVSYGGEFASLIEKEGFEIRHLEPRLTPEKVEYLYKVDQGQTLGYFFSRKEVEEQVRNELVLFQEVQPVAVVTGFNFSNSISCRVAKLPLVWLTQSTWMMAAMYDAGLATYSDMLDLPVLRWLPERTLTWLSRQALGLANLIARPYDQVAWQYGLAPFKSMERLWEGDYNLLAEPEGFCELALPPTCHCIGPLIGRLDAPVPDDILNMPRDEPIVYLAMGSSGQPKVIARIVEGFAGKPYRVIAPVKSHLDKVSGVRIPDNVLVTGWLPAHKVNPLADVSVIHGGIGTVMTACLAGIPVVGVAMQPEQEANVDCLVRKGFAIRIRKNRLTPETLCVAIDQLLADEQARTKAKEYQEIVQRWDNPLLITEFFERTFAR